MIWHEMHFFTFYMKSKSKIVPRIRDRTAVLRTCLLYTSIHPEDNWESRFPVGADNKRNLCAHAEEGDGDVEKILADCDCVVERTYHTKANQQAMMETFRSYTYMDHFGCLLYTSRCV